jgi:SOS-response transcriptional repressor LexA
MSSKTVVRPTKKQRELLEFIETFISSHGYSPSFREIMDGCRYNSVATVALHVNNLVKRGHLQKREHSARSLEVIHSQAADSLPTNFVKPSEEKWLVDKIDYLFKAAEAGRATQTQVDGLYVLVGSLKVLGLDGAAQSFMPRLSTLKKKSQ